MKYLLIITLLVVSGCSEITYKDLTIRRFLWQSKIGKIEATDGVVVLKVENYDSGSQLVELSRELNKTIDKLSTKLVTP